jgi:glutamate-1-semialdehyde aminotransferase
MRHKAAHCPVVNAATAAEMHALRAGKKITGKMPVIFYALLSLLQTSYCKVI